MGQDIFSKSNLDKYISKIDFGQKPNINIGINPFLKTRNIDPELLALLGGAADTASTYSFLKSGKVGEGNALYKPLKNNALATGLAVGGTSLGMKGIRHLIRKKYPKIADALAANQGAYQLGLGVAGINADNDYRSGDDQWRDALSGYRYRR